MRRPPVLFLLTAALASRLPAARPRAAGRRRSPRQQLMRVLGRTVYRRLVWMELPLREARPEIAPLVALEYGFLDASHAEEIAGLNPEVDRVAVGARFDRGDRCFGARHEGRLVSLSWIAAPVARIDYLGLALRLPPGTAYHYDRWTEPSLRGRRVAPATGSRLCRLLASEGHEILAAAVLRENREGMRNAERVGYRPVETIGVVGLGPVRRAFRRRPGERQSGRRRR